MTKIYSAVFCCVLALPTLCQTTNISAGDIAFTAIHSTNSGVHWSNDGFAFVCFIDLNPNTTINFTDAGFVNNAICTNENTLTWSNSTASVLTAGTVVTIDGLNASFGSAAGSILAFNASSGDQCLAYQGNTFLAGISISNWDITCATACTGNTTRTCLPLGLTNGQNAIDISSGGSQVDNGYYNGPTSGSYVTLKVALNDASNWTTSNAELDKLFPSTLTVTPNPVNNPQSFSASPFSDSRIDFSAMANMNNNDVLVAVNSVNSFGNPTGNYNLNDAITGGGTVHYVGPAAGISSDLNLNPSTTYYYRIWSKTAANDYSNGNSVSAKTLAFLKAGDIFFTGFSADGSDGFAFVTFVNLPANTLIRFTDADWDGTTFTSTEGEITWSSLNAVAAGTQITVEALNSVNPITNFGSVAIPTGASSINLEDINEVLYSYIGPFRQPETFVSAIANDGFNSSNGVLTGTGLIAGQTAIAFVSDFDIMAYNGFRTGFTVNGFKALIFDIANEWETEKGANAASNGVSPDQPFSTTNFTFQPYDFSGSWSSNPQGLSTLADDITISSGSVTLTANTLCNNLTVSVGASLTVASGVTLTLNGDLVNNGNINLQNTASLRQLSEIDGNSGAGVFSVERQINVPDHRRFSFYGSPISNVQMGDVFVNSNSSDFYQFDVSSQGFVSQSASLPSTSGKGFITTPSVQTPANTSPVLDTFLFDNQRGGTVNNGSINYAIGAINSGEFALAANPYPSPISAVALVNANSGIDGSLYFWNHSTGTGGGNKGVNTTSDYAIWNFTGATGNMAELPNDYIQSCQGFLVNANATHSNLNIQFTNAMRSVEGNNLQFFKTITDERQRLWLKLASDSAQDQLLIGYLPEATDNFNRLYDGLKLSASGDLNFYSLLDGKRLAIQAKAPLQNNDWVKLGFETSRQGNFSLSLDSISAWPANHSIWLMDDHLQRWHDLKKGAYIFTSPDSLVDQRFYLFTEVSTVGNAALEAEPEKLWAYASKWLIEVNWPKDLAMNEISLFALDGRLLASKKVLESQRLSLIRSNLNQGIYVLVGREENGETYRLKVYLP